MSEVTTNKAPKVAIDYAQYPDSKGHFGPYGGRFVSETLMPALEELESMYNRLKNDPDFQKEFDYDLAHMSAVLHLFTTHSVGVSNLVVRKSISSVKI